MRRWSVPCLWLLAPLSFTACPAESGKDSAAAQEDVDGDGYLLDDCDGANPAIHPNAEEVCDGVDNDCNDQIDEGTGEVVYADADGDGFGDDAVVSDTCTSPTGAWVTEGGDCDDADPGAYPTADEACDGIDNDCDGVADTGPATWYQDLDGDTYGDDQVTEIACDAPPGFVGAAADCDDTRADISPAAPELCDPDDIDEDCDGLADDADGAASGGTTSYTDADGDGYGDDATALVVCDSPPTGVVLGGDCDDTDPTFNPEAIEADCTDPTDYNCDGSTGYADGDGDGWAACEECDDADAAVSPDAEERCNGLDDDCDGEIDGSNAVDPLTWYLDADADGYGGAGGTTDACAAPAGYAASDTDCDDADGAVYPGAAETPIDGIDSDCDGGELCYEDLDGDGYGGTGLLASADRDCLTSAGEADDADDCDDADGAIAPSATELCNSIDDDCDGTIDEPDAADALTWYADADADGYGDPASTAPGCTAPAGTVADPTDCDDADPSISPAGTERCNGIDEDCDGVADGPTSVDATAWYLDADADGHGDPAMIAVDCEAPSGYSATGDDCDDADPGASPSDDEICDGVDDDCDGTIDEPDAIDAGWWYDDVDEDDYGDPATGRTACDAPVGTVGNDGDCDDADPELNPETRWYTDLDGDGYGTGEATFQCLAPADGARFDDDCDDTHDTVYPTAPEICDHRDNECDGLADDDDPDTVGKSIYYLDYDGDGYGDPDLSLSEERCWATGDHLGDNTDCDDHDYYANPDGDEVWYDGLDYDCDGAENPSVCDELPGGTTVTADATCTTSFDGSYSVATEWSTESMTYATAPTYTRVMATPAVGQINDDNGDGVIDALDTPDIVYTTFAGSTYSSTGYLRVMSGDGSGEILSVGTLGSYSVGGAAGVAIGDIDADGTPEIVTMTDAGRVLVINHTGTLQWASSVVAGSPYSVPAIADMDGDGDAEVLAGRYLFTQVGSSLGVGSYCSTIGNIAADIDVDGDQDLVCGGAVYTRQVVRVWDYAGARGGLSAVAQLDSDAQAEIISVNNGTIYALSHDGSLLWSVASGDGAGGGEPAVADLDGDGDQEVAVAFKTVLLVLDKSGAELWRATIRDGSGFAGVVAFDFDHDGAAEIVYADEEDLFILDGTSGAQLYRDTGHASGTNYEHPVVADVDGDGAAEIVVPNNDYAVAGSDGIQVLGSADDQWANAPGVWNQSAYCITNVEDDMSIPASPEASWAGDGFRVASSLDAAPDLEVEILGVCEECATGQTSVYVVVRNVGAAVAPAGLSVALYADNGSSLAFVDTRTTPDVLAAGEQGAPLVFDINNAEFGTSGLRAVVDDDGGGLGAENECDESLNTASWNAPSCP